MGRNLNIGGGGSDNSFGGFVTSNERYGNPTENDKDYIFAWLNNHQAVIEVKLGDFVDANYGDFE